MSADIDNKRTGKNLRPEGLPETLAKLLDEHED